MSVNEVGTRMPLNNILSVFYKVDSPLLPSGLLGPVQIIQAVTEENAR
jgi:hypothetical protein